jgi:hypothetical protein
MQLNLTLKILAPILYIIVEGQDNPIMLNSSQSMIHKGVL